MRAPTATAAGQPLAPGRRARSPVTACSARTAPRTTPANCSATSSACAAPTTSSASSRTSTGTSATPTARSKSKTSRRGTDSQRFALAADAVVDTAGVVNGRPGEIVCRVAAAGRPERAERCPGRLPAPAATCVTPSMAATAIAECAPLNVFGKGNQSAEALNYVDAVRSACTERNEQEQAIASVSGSLWDFWGAGPIGVALGAEYRREATEAIGRDRDTAGRLPVPEHRPGLPEVEYTSEEVFRRSCRCRCSATAAWVSTPSSAVRTATPTTRTVGERRRLRRQPGLSSDPGHHVQDQLQHLGSRAGPGRELRAHRPDLRQRHRRSLRDR